MFLKNKHLLVACSGGVDSVVLCHLLVNSGFEISLAHCNFSLRGKESDTDSDFVIRFAKELDVPIYTETFGTEKYADTTGLSIQMAARNLRYRWFDELSKRLEIAYILTAHHLDDDLETFLINFSRGTGLKGLTGIPTRNNNIVRPLLVFSKDEILAYAEKHRLNWREDSSNFSNKYLRNALRIDVIPKWKEAVTPLLQNFKTTRQHLLDSHLLIEDYISLVLSYVVEETTGGYKLSVSKLKKLPNTKALLYELLHPFGFTEWNDVFQLLDAQTGKKVFSGSHILLKDRDYLFLETINSDEVQAAKTEFLIPENTTTVEDPVKLSFHKVSEQQKAAPDVIFVDYELLQFPLKLKKWEQGDVFYPFGMIGKKKISKFFKDEKLSLLAKQKIWLLCSGNEVVWVVGLRGDNRFKVTNKTKHILKIQLQK